MSRWADKFVIGLTGNIGTGKSVVRRMLERLGAFGIDADALTHSVIARGGPGYHAVIKTFGRWVLGADEEINRARLGRLVFSDPEALALLENIIHPHVIEGVDLLIRHSSQPVVVIEAIKLLESDLTDVCDSVWVVDVPQEVQLARLMENRQMSEADARRRIEAQPPQMEKLQAADVVIQNAGSLDETWKQVADAWRQTVPNPSVREEQAEIEPPAADPDDLGIPLEGWRVTSGRPSQAAEIAGLVTRQKPGTAAPQAEDIRIQFGDKAFQLLQAGDRLVGALGWQVENLVTCVTDIALEPGLGPSRTLPALVEAVESASQELQSEAALVFVPPALAASETVFLQLGYELRTPEQLETEPWQQAAFEGARSQPEGTRMLFKKLRDKPVSRPI